MTSEGGSSKKKRLEHTPPRNRDGSILKESPKEKKRKTRRRVKRKSLLFVQKSTVLNRKRGIASGVETATRAALPLEDTPEAAASFIHAKERSRSFRRARRRKRLTKRRKLGGSSRRNLPLPLLRRVGTTRTTSKRTTRIKRRWELSILILRNLWRSCGALCSRQRRHVPRGVYQGETDDAGTDLEDEGSSQRKTWNFLGKRMERDEQAG